jgi:hypothetical protein
MVVVFSQAAGVVAAHGTSGEPGADPLCVFALDCYLDTLVSMSLRMRLCGCKHSSCCCSGGGAHCSGGALLLALLALLALPPLLPLLPLLLPPCHRRRRHRSHHSDARVTAPHRVLYCTCAGGRGKRRPISQCASSPMAVSTSLAVGSRRR